MNEPKTSNQQVYLACPWCGEADFDLYGLKLHIGSLGGCEKFDACEDPGRPPPRELCDKGRYCGNYKGHEGACDDLPF